MSDFNELINSKKPTLVDFYADWCMPCRTMSPLIEETKKHLGDSATVLKVDIESNSDIARKYSIRSIPTILFFKNGEEVDKQVGAASKDTLSSKIDALL